MIITNGADVVAVSNGDRFLHQPDASPVNSGGDHAVAMRSPGGFVKKQSKHDDEELGKIFVGGLSWDTNQETLLHYFSSFGEVIDCVVMKNADTGRSRGFGFVTFKDPGKVDAVLSSSPHSLDGRTIDPKACNPRSMQKPKRNHSTPQHSLPKVFLGGLPPSITETDLRNFFSTYGEVCEVVIMYDQEKRKSRGFGFLSFADEESCASAVAQHFVLIQNKQVEIKKAEPRMGGQGGNYDLDICNGDYEMGPGASKGHHHHRRPDLQSAWRTTPSAAATRSSSASTTPHQNHVPPVLQNGHHQHYHHHPHSVLSSSGMLTPQGSSLNPVPGTTAAMPPPPPALPHQLPHAHQRPLNFTQNPVGFLGLPLEQQQQPQNQGLQKANLLRHLAAYQFQFGIAQQPQQQLLVNQQQHRANSSSSSNGISAQIIPPMAPIFPHLPTTANAVPGQAAGGHYQQQLRAVHPPPPSGGPVAGQQQWPLVHPNALGPILPSQVPPPPNSFASPPPQLQNPSHVGVPMQPQQQQQQQFPGVGPAAVVYSVPGTPQPQGVGTTSAAMFPQHPQFRPGAAEQPQGGSHLPATFGGQFARVSGAPLDVVGGIPALTQSMVFPHNHHHHMAVYNPAAQRPQQQPQPPPIQVAPVVTVAGSSPLKPLPDVSYHNSGPMAAVTGSAPPALPGLPGLPPPMTGHQQQAAHGGMVGMVQAAVSHPMMTTSAEMVPNVVAAGLFGPQRGTVFAQPSNQPAGYHPYRR